MAEVFQHCHTEGALVLDRLVSMAVFVKAADLGSFTAAASELDMTSQMVSKHVAFLEQRLGTQLINRTTRRQSLTSIGNEYYQRCRNILAENEAAESLVEDLSTTPRGRLRVNAPLTFGTFGVVPLLAGFLKTHPEMEVELTLSDRFVNVVSEGYDLVIRVGPLTDSSLLCRPLMPYRYIACASPGYVAERGSPARPEDLQHHDCVGFMNPSGLPFVDWQFSSGENSMTVRVHPRLRINDQRVLRRAALDDYGILLGAELAVAEDLATGGLVRVLPQWEGPSRPLHLLYPAGRAQTLKVRAFVGLLVDKFGPT